jgi:Lysylphosphatidylglycerol synthase TM region
MRRTLSLLAKTAISILLLYFSLHSIDLGALGARLSRLEPSWVVLALFLLTVQVVLLAVRWRDISAACDATLPSLRLCKSASLLPSSIRCCHRRLAAMACGSGCLRAKVRAGRVQSIRCCSIESLGYSCWRLL